MVGVSIDVRASDGGAANALPIKAIAVAAEVVATLRQLAYESLDAVALLEPQMPDSRETKLYAKHTA